MIVQRSLANGSMLAGGGVQFVVGSVLKGKQSIVSTGYGQEDLVEFALSRALMACLGVLTKIWTAREQGLAQPWNQAITGYFSPSFLASSSRPIFDRPGRSRCLAIS